VTTFDGYLDKITVISDQKKRLLEAVSLYLSHTEHKIYMTHYWKNLKKNYPGDFMSKLSRMQPELFLSMNSRGT